MEIIKVKSVDELPEAVIDEIRRLYLEDGMSPILIIKQIEKNFGYSLPGLHTLVTYLKNIKPLLYLTISNLFPFLTTAKLYTFLLSFLIIINPYNLLIVVISNEDSLSSNTD